MSSQHLLDWRTKDQSERIRKALEGPTLITDGECNLCCRSSSFIASRNSEIFLMWPQHPDTIEVIRKLGISDIKSSLAFIENEKVTRGSSAWIEIGKYLDQPWKTIFGIVRFIPRIFRECIYGIVARNRYQWFGKNEHCQRPETAMLSRFLHPTDI